jgi:hypothetical protein
MTDKAQNAWTRFAVCLMGAITLFSTGWAASATTVWMDVKRIDHQGTQKMIALESRMVKLENTVELSLSQINETLKTIRDDLKEHRELDKKRLSSNE